MTPEQRNKWLTRGAWLAIGIPALYQVGLLLIAIAGRLLYPYDLEWMEGGLLDHAARIQEGNGIYTEPSIEFIPYLYTPLYPALMAILGKVVGLGYVLGRVISVLALVCALTTIFTLGFDRAARGAKLDNGYRLLCGALGAGLVASAYPWVEGWYDIVRGDTLFCAMVVGGLAMLWRWRDVPGRAGHYRIAAVAALLALSYFCKQSGVFFVAAGGANLILWRRWRVIPTYIAVSGVIGLGGTWALQAVTDGWYWTYSYEIFQTHDFHMPRFYGAFKNILGRSIVATIIVAAGLIAVGVRFAAREKLPPAVGRFLFWIVPYATSLLVGALTWGHQWSHFNAYIPAVFLGAVAAATALIAIGELAVAWFPKRGIFLAAALPIALAIELIGMSWNPRPFIPTDRDAAAGARFIERIKATEGDVYVPYHAWYARLAGKETHAHRMGLMDVQYKNLFKVGGMQDAFRTHRFTAVFVDNRPITWIRGLPTYYRIDERIPRSEQPRLFTGAKVVPATVWVPKGPPKPPPKGARVLFDFETGYTGWTATGTAWGRRPRGAGGKDPAYRFTGRFYARSSSGGDEAIGTIESPIFTIDGDRITARIGGGKSDNLRVELRVDGTPVRTATGSGGPRLEPVSWNVSDLRGKRATIALVDAETGPRGYLSADAFWIWDQ